MGKAEKYQRFAEECMELARTAKDARARAVLLHMAEVWLRLAGIHPVAFPCKLAILS